MELVISASFVAVATAAFLCQAYVAFALYQHQQTPRLLPALFHGSRTFVSGWQHAESLGLTRVMTMWSLLTAVFMIALCVLATILTQ